MRELRHQAVDDADGRIVRVLDAEQHLEGWIVLLAEAAQVLVEMFVRPRQGLEHADRWCPLPLGQPAAPEGSHTDDGDKRVQSR